MSETISYEILDDGTCSYCGRDADLILRSGVALELSDFCEHCENYNNELRFGQPEKLKNFDDSHRIILQALSEVKGSVKSKYLVTLLPVEMKSQVLVRKLVWLEKRGLVKKFFTTLLTLGYPSAYWSITPLGLTVLKP